MNPASKTPIWRRASVISTAGAALLLLLFALQASRYSGFLADDALISLQYTKRLLAGDGLTWTAGAPVEGYSNLLWVLVCALPGMIGIDLIVGARILAFASTALTILVLVYSGDRRDPVTGLVAAAYFAVAGPVAIWVFGAMEGSLHGALLACAMFFGCRAWSASDLDQTDLWRASIFFALLTLNRPDGPIFVAGYAAVLLVARRSTTAALRVVALPALAVAGQLGFRLLYYGEWLPNTAYVKIGGSADRLAGGLQYMAGATGLVLELVVVAILATAFATRDRAHRTSALLIIVLSLLWTAYVIVIGGDIFEGFRHLMPLLVILAFGVRIGMQALSERITAPRLRAAVLLACTLPLLGFGWRQWTHPQITTAATNRFVWYGEGLSETLRIAFGAQDPLFAVSAAGCFPYWTGFRCLDMLGLNDHHIARSRPDDFGAGPLAHELGDAAYLMQQEPDLIFIGAPGPGSGRQVGGQYDQRLLDHEDFLTNYRLVRVRSEKPTPYNCSVWMRISSPAIGVRHSENGVEIPAWMFSGNPRTVAELGRSRRLGIRVGPDTPAYLELGKLSFPHPKAVGAHPATSLAIDMVQAGNGRPLLRLTAVEETWVETVSISW